MFQVGDVVVWQKDDTLYTITAINERTYTFTWKTSSIYLEGSHNIKIDEAHEFARKLTKLEQALK